MSLSLIPVRRSRGGTAFLTLTLTLTPVLPLRLLTRWHGATVEDGTSVDVEPLGGRLVIFDSRRILHAVRPAHGEERWALTVWV